MQSSIRFTRVLQKLKNFRFPSASTYQKDPNTNITKEPAPKPLMSASALEEVLIYRENCLAIVTPSQFNKQSAKKGDEIHQVPFSLEKANQPQTPGRTFSTTKHARGA